MALAGPTSKGWQDTLLLAGPGTVRSLALLAPRGCPDWLLTCVSLTSLGSGHCTFSDSPPPPPVPVSAPCDRRSPGPPRAGAPSHGLQPYSRLHGPVCGGREHGPRSRTQSAPSVGAIALPPAGAGAETPGGFRGRPGVGGRAAWGWRLRLSAAPGEALPPGPPPPRPPAPGDLGPSAENQPGEQPTGRAAPREFYL